MGCNLADNIKKIERLHFLQQIKDCFEVNSVCALLGPRQSGKTTLAKFFSENELGQKYYFFDMEDPTDLAAINNPKLLFEQLNGNIIIDEVQRVPELFQYLRTFVDKKPEVKILILGSASRDLIRQSSESLAGRISYLEITPFSGSEVYDFQTLFIRGGFPKSYLATSHLISFKWRVEYIKTYLEQDIPALGINISPSRLRRFWMMLADYHANIFNASEIGRALEIDNKTVKNYLDILSGTFMIRQLSPWFENITKRQVKSSKIYFRDTGILQCLLGIDDEIALLVSSKIGALWEGFALEEVARFYQAEQNECFFWATQSGAEIDLLIVKGSKKLAFEFKYTSDPKLTKSMISAIESLNLDFMTVVIPGKARFRLSEKVIVIGLESLITG